MLNLFSFFLGLVHRRKHGVLSLTPTNGDTVIMGSRRSGRKSDLALMIETNVSAVKILAEGLDAALMKGWEPHS